MMLSELYGRIGQILNENGDAPIADIKVPMFPPFLLKDFYVHKHVDVVPCSTQIPIDGRSETLKSYNIVIEKT